MDSKVIFFAVACFAVTCAALKATREQMLEVFAKCNSQDRAFLSTVSLNDDCRTYFTCAEFLARNPTIQYCPAGTLYDESTHICNFAMNVDCAARNAPDPCSGQSDGFHQDDMRSKDQQAAVLNCLNGKTMGGFQCDVCSSFGGANMGCVPISGCNRVEDIPAYECFLEAIPENNLQYISKGVDSRTVKDCSGGTVFSIDACGCVAE